MSYIVQRGVVVLVGLVLSWLVWRYRHRLDLPIGVMIVSAYALRVAGLIILHAGLGVTIPIDLRGYYDHTQWVLEGQVPNSDFSVNTGLLFSYLTSGAVALVDHPLSIAVLFQVTEGLGLWLALSAAKTWMPERGRRVACALYLINPLVLSRLWLAGQDECMQILALGIVLRLVQWRPVVPTVLGTTAVVYATKVFALWMVVPLAIRKGAKWIAVAVVVNVLLALALYAVGIEPVRLTFSRPDNQADQLAQLVSAGNIWSLLLQLVPELSLGVIPKVVAVVSLVVTAVFLALNRHRGSDAEFLLVGTALVTLIFQITYMMTFPQYVVTVVLALLLVLLGRDINDRWVPPLVAWTAILPFSHWLYPVYHRVPFDSALVGLMAYAGVESMIVVANLAVLVLTLILMRRWSDQDQITRDGR